MDPYEVLQVAKDYTLDQLKKQYKKMIIRYHPDLNSDIKSTPMFQALTEAYKKLHELHTMKAKSPEHHQLKKTFNDKGTCASTSGANREFVASMNQTSFDNTKFNELYEKFSLKDEVQTSGYGDWLNSDKDMDVVDKAIIHYEEPQAMMGSKLFGNFSEFGIDKITDFSNYQGMQYMDLRKAHTTTKLVDETSVKMPKEFKSLDQIRDHRSKVEYIMTPDQQQEHGKKLEKENIVEQKRLNNIKKQDTRIDAFYKKNYNMMLSHLQSTK
jgi:hypothetical protein